LTFLALEGAGLTSVGFREVAAMIFKTEILERDILRVFRCACRQNRPDIAEFMLTALEKLDSERSNSAAGKRPLMDAYRDLAASCECEKV